MSERRIQIEAQNLRVRYEALTALSVDHLKVDGRIIALVGHNGAGKSTLIKTVLGLRPFRGILQVTEASPLGSLPLAPEKDMAFCPENGAVFNDISVESYLKLWCRIKHGDSSFYRHGGSKIIEQLEIPPLLKRMGRELSKGQRRRLQAAIGFLTNPRLFLFDEPFDGLDVQRSSELSELIALKAQAMSFIISSHRMDVIERLADQVIVLRAGTIAACDTPGKVARLLAGRTVQIHGLTSPIKILDALRTNIPGAVLSQRGAQLLVTTKALSNEQLEAFLISNGETKASLLEIPPSLSDAIDYFLRQSSGKISRTSE